MDLDRLKQRWQEQPAPSAEWQQGEDVEELRKKLNDLRRTAAARDLREYSAVAVVAPIFAWVAVVAPRPLAQAGAAVIVLASIFIVVWMWMAGGRHKEPETDLAVVEFFARDLRYVERQIRLLQTVLWWYLGPLFIGLTLFFLGAAAPMAMRALLIAVGIATAAVIYRMNQAAARSLMPLRDDIARMLRDLQSNGASA
jgi:hypothetical protein